MKSHSKFLSFIEMAKGITNKLPKYNSKFSNRIYSNHQLMMINLFRVKLKLTYRGVCELLGASRDLCRLMGINKIPHWTTLQKFMQRTNQSSLDWLIKQETINLKQVDVAIDATGFYPLNVSSYYCLKYLKGICRRKYVKLSILIDVKTQLILSTRTRLSPAHDNLDFKCLIRKCKIKILSCRADKAYCAFKNYEFLYQLGIRPLIPVKKNIHRRRLLMKRVAKDFDEKDYHQRSKCETVNGSIKVKFDARLLAKRTVMQKKEILIKCVVYNLDRLVALNLSFFIEGFYKAD